MGKNMYQEGYQQAARDFTEGKGYKPHDLDNLLKLVIANDKQNEAFLQGYRAGYDFCSEQALEQYAREAMQARPGGTSPPRTSPNRLDQLRAARNRFPDAPEHEPEY